MHYNWFILGKELRSLEKRRRRAYKYVVFLRPDVFFPAGSTFSHWSKQPHKLLRIQNDWAMFLPRIFADSALLGPFSVYTSKCAKVDAAIRRFCPRTRLCSQQWTTDGTGIEQAENVAYVATATKPQGDCDGLAAVENTENSPCEAQLLRAADSGSRCRTFPDGKARPCGRRRRRGSAAR